MSGPGGLPLLIVSNGGAEDSIGAALLLELRRLGVGEPGAGTPGARMPGAGGPEWAAALPLVGEGAAYAGLVRRTGPPLRLPSGGFPFGSAANLRADLKAGLVRHSLRQWAAAWRAGAGQAGGPVVVVGDSYALMVGALAARRQEGPGSLGGRLPLIHLQPLVSRLYLDGLSVGGQLRELNALGANAFMPWELALGRRAARVYTRDAPSAQYLARRGVNAAYRGSFALDLLPPPERDLDGVRTPGGEPLLARPLITLLPGHRGDAASALPVMLEAARLNPQWRMAVAWPRPLEDLPLPAGVTLIRQDGGAADGGAADGGAADDGAADGGVAWLTGVDLPPVAVLRGAFSALLRRSRLVVGTAGTASEQAAGLGLPVVGFPTAGPQYVPGFARRQRRLLGEALTLTAADGAAVSAALRRLDGDAALYARASAAGRARVGEAGALAQIAAELVALWGRR